MREAQIPRDWPPPPRQFAFGHGEKGGGNALQYLIEGILSSKPLVSAEFTNDGHLAVLRQN